MLRCIEKVIRLSLRQCRIESVDSLLLDGSCASVLIIRLRIRLNLLSFLLRSQPNTNGGTKRDERSESGMPQKNIKNINNQENPAASGPSSPLTVIKITMAK